jgi:hypothetical protein
MPNRQYEAGDRWEKRVMNDLRRRGYICWQTRGSKTAVDIIAFNTDELDAHLLLQAKSGEKITDHAAWNGLVDLSKKLGTLSLVADRDGRKIRYRRITGYHTYRSRDWPAEAYDP